MNTETSNIILHIKLTTFYIDYEIEYNIRLLYISLEKMLDVRYYSINAFLNFNNFYEDIYRLSCV